jgi:DnaJ-class molecular chaperone
MPGRYKITLPEAQEERAKKAAILAIETVGKAYNEFAASVISDKFDHCKRCMGSGLLESSDSTDDGLYDCYTCKGTGRKEV